MGHTLTLGVPEDVYQVLQQQAKQTGQSPATVAVQLLAATTQPHTPDPSSSLLARLAAKGLTGLTIMMPIWGSPSEKLCAAKLLKVILMPDIFADTAGWGSLVDASQAYHTRAATLYCHTRQQGHKFITTNYILTELVVLLLSSLRMPRPRLTAFIEGLKASPHVEIVHVDPTLDAQAWQLFTERPDKEWSLVGCASFVVVRQRGLLEAFTTDHHFEQAGFVCLLKA